MIRRSLTDLYIYDLHVAEFRITKVSVIFFNNIFLQQHIFSR